MNSTGYILNGVYYSGMPEVGHLKEKRASTDKLYSHDRQREEHRRDLLQPRMLDGKPNPEFIAQYPDIAKQYGFIKE